VNCYELWICVENLKISGILKSGSISRPSESIPLKRDQG
jgi:hypothetical protein